ncbi:MAG: ABC transporter permease [Gemmatimonadaceae bacterium]
MAMRERFSEIAQDTKYAARGLLNRPAFTMVAVLTLAVGIGANTAIFSAVNALILRPLPVREPERLMEVYQTGPGDPGSSDNQYAPWSWPKFVIYRDAQHSFSDMALWADDQFTLTDGISERVYGELVSARYLSTLGVRVPTGQDFPRDEDAHGGAPRMVVISHALWSRRYNSDPGTIGRTVDILGKPYEVVGVLPPTFRGLSGRAEVLVPITTRDVEELSEPWSLQFSLIARLKPGATVAAARSEAALLGKRVYEATPMGANQIGSGASAPWGAGARPLDDTRVAPTIRRSLFILAGAVGLVLLIACVNLANLLLGRSASRKREIAVRLAIGAGRRRLVQLLLTESVLLSLVGGMASLAVAAVGTRALALANSQTTLQAQNLAGLGLVAFADIRLDLPALAFTLAVALVVGILFGLAPALQSTNAPLQSQLRQVGDGARAGGSAKHITSRRLLVVTEIAMALVLLVGAGLLIRSLKNRLEVNPGFDASQLLTMRLTISPTEVPRDSMPGFYSVLLERLGGIPGVQQAALTDCPPLNGGCNVTIITFPDRPRAPQGTEPGIGVHFVTPTWFSTMRVPLKRGRLFTDADRVGAPKVVVISEAAAKKYWPNADPIGSRVAVYQGGFHEGATVVGVAGDVRYGTIDSLPVPDVYISYEQSPRSNMMVLLRTTVEPTSVSAAAQKVVTALSPRYPSYDVRSMASRVVAATAQARLTAILFALFGGTALALAVIGIYGVMSFAVVQRTREIGIRMALGADRRGVLRLVIGEGLWLAAIGTVVGLMAALALTRVLGSLLYDITPSDPITYVGIVALLGAVAMLASWIPARRASRVDPVEALRIG